MGQRIEHDGTHVPVAVGTRVEVVARYFSGKEIVRVGTVGSSCGASWLWALVDVVFRDGEFVKPSEFIRWRLAEDPQSEIDAAQSRQALFDQWRQNPTAPVNAPEGPVRSPEREKAVR